MTQVYITDCTPLMDESIIQHLLPRMDKRRQDKIRSLQALSKKAQSTTAGLLLEYCFGTDACYRYGEKGKPYLVGKDAYFSISHSTQWVALAVSDTEIGADIQVISPIRSSVLRRCFTNEEQEWIGSDAERFTRLWTQKEAYAKYTGRGITAPLPDSVADANPVYYADRYENTYITVCGDNAAQIIPINIKDLL